MALSDAQPREAAPTIRNSTEAFDPIASPHEAFPVVSKPPLKSPGDRWFTRKKSIAFLVTGILILSLSGVGTYLLLRDNAPLTDAVESTADTPKQDLAGMTIDEATVVVAVNKVVNEAASGMQPEVTCPSDVPIQVGGRFNCTGVMHPAALPGTEVGFTANIVQTDSRGNVEITFKIDPDDEKALSDAARKSGESDADQLNDLQNRLNN